MSTTTLTRRAVVTAAPAALVAASLPAIAGTGLPTFGDAHPDAALLALREPYERTLAAVQAVSPAHNRAEEAAFAALTAAPDRDRAEVEREVGLDAAEAEWEAALDVNGDVIRRIQETPAHTLAGVLFKARVCAQESYESDLAASIVADLVAMGERNA